MYTVVARWSNIMQGLINEIGESSE